MIEKADIRLTSWREHPFHRDWLSARAETLFSTFQSAAINPRGGFFDLDESGAPIRDAEGSGIRNLHATCRMVFSFSVAQALGRPGADRMIDHGMDYLWSGHRDARNGGYHWGMGDNGPADSSKQAYGHAFVLLAGASAKRIGHPDADRLLNDATEVLETRFWEPEHGAVSEEYTTDWQPLGEPYRGQNSNMHLTEALMAAFEATKDERYLRMAESIADLIIRRAAAENGWRLPEHFTPDWTVNRDYAGSEMFRPAGTTPGHWLEWSRLLGQLWVTGGRRHGWMMEAAEALFRSATAEGWDAEHGGFFYTLDWQGQPRWPDKMWWTTCEGIGAAAFLGDLTGDPFYEEWYQRIWGFAANHVIEGGNGRWIPQIGPDLALKTDLFSGQPDIYHALQACLIPLFPARGSLLHMALEAAKAPEGA